MARPQGCLQGGQETEGKRAHARRKALAAGTVITATLHERFVVVHGDSDFDPTRTKITEYYPLSRHLGGQKAAMFQLSSVLPHGGCGFRNVDAAELEAALDDEDAAAAAAAAGGSAAGGLP